MNYTALLAPQRCYRLANRCVQPLAIIFAVTFLLAIAWGLYWAPTDYQQGEGYRIIFIHVPSAFLSMSIYMIMASMAFVFLVWKVKVAAIWMRCSAQIGAWYAFLALFTGSVWGKPMWGTWWIWDARLTSTLILFFIYLGVIAIQQSVQERTASDKVTAVLVLIGAINIPIIHFSVIWWNTLHQGATISRFWSPSIASSMLVPLLVMMLAFFVFYLFILCLRLRTEIMQREYATSWVQEVLKQNG